MKPMTTPLPEILEEKLPKIHEICQRHHVRYLWVFGSVLEKEFREDSDIDFLYEWDRPSISEGEYLPNLDSCIESLQALFGRKIDFIHYPSLRNPYFIKSVEATKILLYAKRPEEVPV
ncbi:MAG: nucleotidyltransferase domain-containing protein [Bacteroidia bacterium]|nr:nucleotidyltransferase domain-containing protein [Bacteroidia bacterium]